MTQTIAMLTDSRKAMWRAIMALASVDGEIEPQEKAVLLDYIRSNKFPAEFEAQLLSDLETLQDFETYFAAVTDAQDRMYVINAALVIFHSDDDFEAPERKLFALMNEQQCAQVDFKQAAKNARDMVAQFKREDAQKMENAISESLWIVRMFHRFFPSL